ncbi:hypothetical protein GPALN_003171 [Globodera pallida]|nr:hypothetical protein GPALN_003171 [Globodera pallida]
MKRFFCRRLKMHKIVSENVSRWTRGAGRPISSNYFAENGMGEFVVGDDPFLCASRKFASSRNAPPFIPHSNFLFVLNPPLLRRLIPFNFVSNFIKKLSLNQECHRQIQQEPAN